MSQGKEETTLKYITKNNSNNYCNNNTGNTITMVKNNNKNSNNQQVMPFYENCTFNHNSRHNNNSIKGKADHHFALQHSPSQSVAFNYEEHFVRATSCSNSHNAFLNDNVLREKSCELSDYEYENIDITVEQQQYQSDKRLLLQKYFRSALVGPRANIYENLCRGCNYGVFNARGPLCSFCECIVNGVTAVTSDTSQQSGLNESNIYENVCELCGLIYSGSEGNICKCRLSSDLELEREFNGGSEEQLLDKNTLRDKKTKKINKSKSFSKANRPKIFTTFWETLRKPRGQSTVVNIKKPLEIVHHVEGYDQVFHTKDTFDLQRICELKRSTTSCSDQHIYGRVKQHDLHATHEEEFNSTQSLTQTDRKNCNKKPRISKAKFLRSIPRVKAKVSHNHTSSETIYLSSSVCHWMTSLRREVHAYNNEELECYPKSIPSKNVLNFCKVAPVTNIRNYLAFGDGSSSCASSSGDTEIPCTQLTSSKEFSEIVQEQQPNEIADCYQLLVEEFMANIMYRQHKNNNKNNNNNVITNTNVKVTMAGVNSNNSDNNSQHIDIALRQNPMTSTAMTSQTTNHVNNRQKRQGMYLRLEEEHNYQHLQLPSPHEQRQQQQLPNDNNNNPGETLGYLQNREHIITNSLNNSIKDLEEHNIDENNLNNENIEHNNTVNATISTCISTPARLNDNELGDLVSRCLKPNANGKHLLQTDKRCAIHERNILEDFEALMQQEKLKNASLQTIPKSIEISELESQNLNGNIFASPIKDLKQLISLQQMSAGLNTAIICYDKYLVIFLRFITQTASKRRELLFVNTSTNTSLNANTNKRLVRKFQRFYRKCEEINKQTTAKQITYKPHMLSSNLKLDLNVQPTRSNIDGNGNRNLNVKNHESDSLSECSCCTNLDVNNINKRGKIRPQVPKRDPKTKLSPTVEIKQFSSPTTIENPTSISSSINKMTVPSTNVKNETTSTECTQKEEESIYQPIWQFETKGQVTERYRTDDDYYDLKALKEKLKQDSPHTEIPKILISDDILLEEEEDHNNWEPDEEFVFTKQMHKKRSSSLNSESISTMRSSSHSSNSSIVTSSSLSGSTITEFASSTATFASALASSLKDYPYRNIGIFYSLTEPQIRAIVYNYDRVHSATYFNKLNTLSDQLKKNVNDSGIGKSLSPLLYNFRHRSPSNSPSSSCKSSPVALTKREFVNKTSKPNKTTESATTPLTIPESVKAWQRQLLSVNYMEDEEDLIVSECEILRAKETKDVADQSYDSQSPPAMPLFKSRSTENLIDDKKTITERLANMYTRFSPIQRGILNINGRSSPKSEKKYKINRASQTTSLYLEPKYPIFGAPLEQLELQQNVPRFVVDAIDYIERKDRITQDGIYRACGNKFSIDELKQKLTNACIYDSKLMTADDIHTVTSLLKQFFRDLPEPVVPQDIYNRITSNLSDKESVDTIRIAIEEMREPNKSTLRFLIKHLTNVAACSSSNRMNASNVAIVWGPSLFAHNDTYDMIGRMNTLTKVLIESYDRIFDTNERLL